MNSIHHAVLHALFTLASSDRHATVLRVVEEAGRHLPGLDRDQVVSALVALDRAGVAYDAVLGDVQYVDRSGERIALHGANEVEGIINVVAPYGAFQRSDLEPEVPAGDPIPGRTEVTCLRVGGYPITYGASTLMVVEFGAIAQSEGEVVIEAGWN